MADGMKMEALLLLLSVCLALCASHLHASPNHPDDGHHQNGEHNPDYDKKMFLGGEEEADDFAELSPEEQQRRLKSIIRKIDIDANGYLTVDELSLWIQKSFKHYILEDTKEQFAEVDLDNDGTVTWEEYNIHMYDRIIDYSEDTILEDDEEESFRLIHMKDKKRFERADQDDNSGLNLQEFSDFEHPEETDYMLEFVIEGALEDHDKDGDGFVSLDEYLGEYSQDPGLCKVKRPRLSRRSPKKSSACELTTSDSACVLKLVVRYLKHALIDKEAGDVLAASVNVPGWLILQINLVYKTK